jgi:hypothetical protein
MVPIQVTGTVRFAAVATSDYFKARGRPVVPRDLLAHDCIRFRFDRGPIYRWES